MSYDGELPELTEYPDADGLLAGPGVSLPVVIDGYGLIAAQSGEDYHQVLVQTAISSDPRHGVLSVTIDAEGARGLANHLLHLANYAELGLPSEAPSE